MRKDGPLAVEVPAHDRDSPGWVRVGIIAAVGFVIGIAWPRVVGVKLGPSAPGEAAAIASAAALASASAARLAGSAPEAPPASVSKSGAPVVAPPGGSATASATRSPPAGPPQISVLRGAVLSCKTTEGEAKKGKDCGAIAALDNVVAPHLKKLATCSAAEGQTGKLSFMATADFPSGRLGWEVGKSSTVGNLDGIVSCLKTHFAGVTAGGVAHEHARYTVAYNATFSPPLEAVVPAKIADKTDKKENPDAPDRNAKDDKSDKDAPPGGEASVGWEVALVRDVPKTGAVVARLPRGTKVKLGPVKDGWYAIKFGEGFATDGFVYRAAIGR